MLLEISFFSSSSSIASFRTHWPRRKELKGRCHSSSCINCQGVDPRVHGVCPCIREVHFIYHEWIFISVKGGWLDTRQLPLFLTLSHQQGNARHVRLRHYLLKLITMS
ncbi:hypothetical protein AVEN_269570-1 [Araneus ventricosus]|uniref:Uncharacterized protein n=1 Tax=Araneus ventricosus TaxID=182803 RepID=A0A4Y2CDL8_ARAVE|nr:hypothetical protein AVEN_269570-1 [Araneus ventricosus]